tara:strand:+ start:61 stop:246 length:186 start_codon:yes stop_codon:yes gene_type:complete
MNYKEIKIMGILGLKCYNSIQEKYFDMKYLSTLSSSEVSDILEKLRMRDNVVPNCDECTVI